MPRPRVFAALGVFVREGFLSPELQARVLAAARADTGEPSEIFSPASSTGATGLHPEVRRAWEVALPDDVEGQILAALDTIRPSLEKTFDVPLGEHEGVAALRYPEGAFYRPHRDRRQEPSAFDAHERAVSVVVFVNGAAPGEPPPFDGGRLRLYECLAGEATRELGLDVEPEAGTLVAFRSKQLHEVTPVTRGERVTLVTWFHQRCEHP
jgi:predicted 2-oxoglutarate/Fe(II)-dependent dioxygenase YbiX